MLQIITQKIRSCIFLIILMKTITICKAKYSGHHDIFHLTVQHRHHLNKNFFALLFYNLQDKRSIYFCSESSSWIWHSQLIHNGCIPKGHIVKGDSTFSLSYSVVEHHPLEVWQGDRSLVLHTGIWLSFLKVLISVKERKDFQI